jgi:hypothetical protein
MSVPMTVIQLCQKMGMSRQNYYQSRLERQRREVDSGLIEQLVRAERAISGPPVRCGLGAGNWPIFF